MRRWRIHYNNCDVIRSMQLTLQHSPQKRWNGSIASRLRASCCDSLSLNQLVERRPLVYHETKCMLHPTKRWLYGYLRVTIINRYKYQQFGTQQIQCILILKQNCSKEFNIGEYNLQRKTDYLLNSLNYIAANNSVLKVLLFLCVLMCYDFEIHSNGYYICNSSDVQDICSRFQDCPPPPLEILTIIGVVLSFIGIVATTVTLLLFK